MDEAICKAATGPSQQFGAHLMSASEITHGRSPRALCQLKATGCTEDAESKPSRGPWSDSPLSKHYRSAIKQTSQRPYMERLSYCEIGRGPEMEPSLERPATRLFKKQRLRYARKFASRRAHGNSLRLIPIIDNNRSATFLHKV